MRSTLIFVLCAIVGIFETRIAFHARDEQVPFEELPRDRKIWLRQARLRGLHGSRYVIILMTIVACIGAIVSAADWLL